MSTIKIILKPQSDGTLHLPLPPEMQKSNVEVTAFLQPVSTVAQGEPQQQLDSGFGMFKGKIHIAENFDEPLDDMRDYM